MATSSNVGKRCNTLVIFGDRINTVTDRHCRCKGKAGFWRGLLNSVGSAIGQAKFGGEN